jgi:hypothetical protein
MCVHPEAFSWVKNFRQTRGSDYHTVYNKPENLPSKAQWMIRNTNYESTDREKYSLKTETEELRR